ncbi:MAG: pilus assembly protein TadG-related protein [Actinomycetota bacterium]|nr:pilus assembly protein TadG-related protein [Actinomycetota bacterium]
MAGLAVDGTRAFLFRQTLQNVADASAVAAAGEISRAAYYSSGGRDLRLDPGEARRTAMRWLARPGIRLEISVVAGSSSVHVVARGAISPTFLAMIGVRRIPVAVEAAARPLGGGTPRL